MNNNIIEGNPTKSFFIQMITRDITVSDAIIDLLDNSIDGASKLRTDGDYDGLFIDIRINKDEFIVKDNCGGFSLEVAQKYAFRFGRPDDAPKTEGSVGRFGIGMKRALFKMGKSFKVESKTDENHFDIKVNVEDWKNQKEVLNSDSNGSFTVEDWSFKYEMVDGSSNLVENGTYIEVKELTKEVSDLFDDASFLNDLRDDIERLLNFSLQKKIKISLNGLQLSCNGIEILFSDDVLKPYHVSGEKLGVSYKIIAGLGKTGFPSLSGWYIFCNDRLVLEADRSEITGWGTAAISQWHIDHVMFRGVVFLDSNETINLPLTTTKKGIDATSELYKGILPLMKEAMQRINPFLRGITRLGNDANNYRRLLEEQERKMSVIELKTYQFSHQTRTFFPPYMDMDRIAEKKDTVRIAYDTNREIATKAKNYSGSKSYKDLGELTFSYYIQMEELNNE